MPRVSLLLSTGFVAAADGAMNTTTAPLSQLQVFLAVARLSSFSAARARASRLDVGREPVGAAAGGAARASRSSCARRAACRSPTKDGDWSRARDRARGRRSTRSRRFRRGRASRWAGSDCRFRVPPFRSSSRPCCRRSASAIRACSSEIILDERFVDIVAAGYDAGVRLTEAIERDMVQVRLTERLSLHRRRRAELLRAARQARASGGLLEHECITYRSQTNGALYAWELERGRKSWRVPVRGGVVTNDSSLARAARGRRARRWPTPSSPRSRPSCEKGASSASSTPTRRRCPGSSSTILDERSARHSCGRSSTPPGSWFRARVKLV